MTPTPKIWHNGQFIAWNDAKIHVLSHVVSYGSSVFEGIRCYETTNGPAIFRLREHMRRMIDSAKIYRMEVPYTVDQLCEAAVELVRENKLAFMLHPADRASWLWRHGRSSAARIRSRRTWPAGSGASISATKRSAQGVDVCISSWNRIAPNTLPALAKAGANYMNSQLIRMEADVNGYAEGIALDQQGYVSEGSGENIFVVRDGKILTPPLGASVLPGITRDSILKLAQSPGYSDCGNDHSARAALHRRRGVFHRNGGRDYADPVSRSDHGRRRPPRPDHRTTPEGIFRHRQRNRRGPIRLADASEVSGVRGSSEVETDPTGRA